MNPSLFHIYGPIYIQSYGLAIAVGLIIFIWLIQKHPRFKQLHLEQSFTDILFVGIIAGIVGGRLLYILTEGPVTSWVDVIAIWQGGFSILGTIIAILLVVPWYIRYRNVPILPFFDLIAIHAGLLQAISRLGCFCAGCCYGSATYMPWGVCYTDPHSFAPLGVVIHPAQLYSVIGLLCIFLFMYYVAQKRLHFSGQLASCYVMLESIERFIVDFWRADQVYFYWDTYHILSANQIIAMMLSILGFTGMIYFTKQAHRSYE